MCGSWFRFCILCQNKIHLVPVLITTISDQFLGITSAYDRNPSLPLGLKTPVPPWDVHAWPMSPLQSGIQTWRILFSRSVVNNAEHGEMPTSSPSHEKPFHPDEGCLGLCSCWCSPLTHGNLWAAPISMYFSHAPPCSILRYEILCVQPAYTTLVCPGAGCWYLFKSWFSYAGAGSASQLCISTDLMSSFNSVMRVGQFASGIFKRLQLRVWLRAWDLQPDCWD